MNWKDYKTEQGLNEILSPISFLNQVDVMKVSKDQFVILNSWSNNLHSFYWIFLIRCLQFWTH